MTFNKISPQPTPIIFLSKQKQLLSSKVARQLATTGLHQEMPACQKAYFSRSDKSMEGAI